MKTKTFHFQDENTEKDPDISTLKSMSSNIYKALDQLNSLISHLLEQAETSSLGHCAFNFSNVDKNINRYGSSKGLEGLSRQA